MFHLSENDINELAKLIMVAFSNDPKLEIQMNNLERKEQILQVQSKKQIMSFIEKGNIQRLEKNNGISIGYYSKAIGLNDFIEIINSCSEEIMKVITEDELKLLIENSEKLKNIEHPVWFHELKEDYYHLLVVAVDKKLKGSGAFRKLITPVLSDCDEKRIKIVLETNNEQNVKIFKHFGFDVVKEISDDMINIKQYCMVRNPVGE